MFEPMNSEWRRRRRRNELSRVSTALDGRR